MSDVQAQIDAAARAYVDALREISARADVAAQAAAAASNAALAAAQDTDNPDLWAAYRVADAAAEAAFYAASDAADAVARAIGADRV